MACMRKVRRAYSYVDVLLTVQLSIYILVINQLDAQNLCYNKFISSLYMFRAPCAHRQEVKIVLYSLWYHRTYRWPSRAQAERGLRYFHGKLGRKKHLSRLSVEGRFISKLVLKNW